MQRIVLMDFDNGKFYQPDAQWTDSALSAHNFKDEQAAAKVGQKIGGSTLVGLVTSATGELVKGTKVQDYPRE